MIKNLPATWETWVQSLGREDPLEKEIATNSSLLAGRIPWTEEPGGPQSMGSLKRPELATKQCGTVNLSFANWRVSDYSTVLLSQETSPR